MNGGWRLHTVLFLLFCLPLFAQNSTVLDRYLAEGLQNNIVIQQRRISYDKAVQALEIAKSLWLPSVSFLSTYSHGEGGRAIAIPVGDLMNPVYSTLNQLLSRDVFPQIDNVKEGFFPLRFYDIRVRTTMPLLNPEIGYNREINEAKLKITEYETNIFKLDLIKEIKTAYWNYLAAVEAINIHLASKQLAGEAKRVAESLLTNGKGLPLHVLRAESEIQSIEATLAQARADSQKAAWYFNFLLNRDLNTPVEVDSVEIPADIAGIEAIPPAERDELLMLRSVQGINRSLVELNRSDWIPRISGMLDLGLQNSDWVVNRESFYYFFGIELELPLFEGFRARRRIETAELDLKSSELDLQQTENALKLTAATSVNELKTAFTNYRTAENHLKTAASYARLAEKAWNEGAGTFIETVDARAQLSIAGLNANICKFRVLTALAEYERQNLNNRPAK